MSLNNPFTRLEFRWTCTLGLIFPIGHFGPLPEGLDDDTALAHLRTRSDLGSTGLTTSKLMNFDLIPARGIDETVHDEVVRFERVTTGQRGRVIHATLTTPEQNCIDMKNLLVGIWRVDHDGPDPHDFTIKLEPELRDVIMASHGRVSSFTCSHPELTIYRFSGTAGLDSAWNAILPTIHPTASMRCLRLTGDDRIFASPDRKDHGAVLAAFRRAEAEKDEGRIKTGQNSFTITGIQNKTLFQQLEEMQASRQYFWVDKDGKRQSGWREFPVNFFSIIWATEGYLTDKDPGFDEEERLSYQMGLWMKENSSRLDMANTPAGIDVMWGNICVARWNKSSRRLLFQPVPNKANGRIAGVYSQKIDPEEIYMIFPAMIIDALTARSMLDPGSQRSSWLGPMASSVAGIHEQLQEFGLLKGHRVMN